MYIADFDKQWYKISCQYPNFFFETELFEEKKQGTKDFFVVKLIFCLHEGRRRISDKENESQTAKKMEWIFLILRFMEKCLSLYYNNCVMDYLIFQVSNTYIVIKYPLYVQFYKKRLFESCLAPTFYISLLKKYD